MRGNESTEIESNSSCKTFEKQCGKWVYTVTHAIIPVPMIPHRTASVDITSFLDMDLSKPRVTSPEDFPLSEGPPIRTNGLMLNGWKHKATDICNSMTTNLSMMRTSGGTGTIIHVAT